MSDVHLLLQCGLRIEALMEKLVAQQQQTPQCCCCVTMAIAPEEVPEDPTYDRFCAAIYLEKSERTVTRWRNEGKLNYIIEDGKIRYAESVLDARYLKVNGFPKKKKKKGDNGAQDDIQR
ncbi:hypothetical protein SAMN05216436_11327 [bacterium A37T11]|nr:hypothetical protein SAMN05216436_11327 [bacterium A37T11]